jgi:hypothetical protein
MLFIIKIALTLFVLGFLMIGAAGITLCFQLIQKLSSTVRTIIYIGITTTSFVTILMNLSYEGVPLLALYFMGFILIGFCSIPIRIFMGDY